MYSVRIITKRFLGNLGVAFRGFTAVLLNDFPVLRPLPVAKMKC